MNHKKIMYAILKELADGNIAINADDFGINWKQYQEIALSLYTEGLINKKPAFTLQGVSFKTVQLTFKGEDFLSENAPWKKAYKGLKEVKSWLTLG